LLHVTSATEEVAMAINSEDDRMVAGNTVLSVVFVAAVIGIVLALGAWYFNHVEVGSLRDASQAPTTTPVPKDPGTTLVPRGSAVPLIRN
jgi:hypothetical protein